MKSLIHILLFSALAFMAPSILHNVPNEGIHHHADHSLSISRNWKYTDKSLAATGSFMMAKEGKVFIEKAEGIISIPIESLSWVDQKYVNHRLKEIELINSKLILNESPREATLMRWIEPLTGIAVLFGMLLAAYLLRQPHTKGTL